MPAEVEQRSVSIDDLRAGIRLRGGHPVVLVVSGVRGKAAARERAEVEEESGAAARGPDQALEAAAAKEQQATEEQPPAESEAQAKAEAEPGQEPAEQKAAEEDKAVEEEKPAEEQKAAKEDKGAEEEKPAEEQKAAEEDKTEEKKADETTGQGEKADEAKGEPIEAISGPDSLTVGQSADYSITKDSRAEDKKGENATWSLEVYDGGNKTETVDCGTDSRCAVRPDGMSIASVPGQWSHRRVKVLAYAQDAAKAATAESNVVFTEQVIADSWTLPVPQSQGHRPGVGPDMDFNDFTIPQYRAIGPIFDRDYNPGGLGTRTDQELFTAFRNMAYDSFFSFSHGELKDNTRAMIDNFQSNQGSEYTNAVLTQHARDHASTKRFVTGVRTGLQNALRTARGNTAALPQRLPRIPSPVYNTYWDTWQGLTIAINDTWAFEVRLTDYQLTGPSSYRANLRMIIYDHFGLDREDVDNRPPGNYEGFRAWFILQHVRGYRPFVTRVEWDEVFEDSF